MIKKLYRRLCVAFVFFFLLGSSVALAQSSVVTGKVTDERGQVLPGVNVIKKGTTTGTSTDAIGNFSVEASSVDILIFSFIGYQSQEVTVGNQTRINISLLDDVSTLDEVVVTGYGVTKKSDVTGAVASVSSEKLKGTVVANVDQALQGRIAGVQITQNSGSPGAAATVNIRGVSSLGDNQPLYVIDGVQITGQGGSIQGFSDGGNGQTRVNPLSSISPNDIETIDVLKDASATAIYGSRASNGVIIITTKRGKAGESVISYNGYYGVQTVRKKLDMMNLSQYADYRKDVALDFADPVDERFRDPSLLGDGTDWQDEVFRSAATQNHQLSARGGSDKNRYAIMGGYFNQDGIAINSNLERFNTRVNLDSKVNSWFDVGTSISYTKASESRIIDGSGDGVFSQALVASPDVPVRDANGEFAGPQSGRSSSEVRYNPVALALLKTNTFEQQRFIANTYGEASILKNLKFRSEIAIDNSNTQNVNFNPTYRWGSLLNETNELNDKRETSFFWLWKNYVTYDVKLGNRHSLTTVVGTEAQKNNYQNVLARRSNLPTNDIKSIGAGELVPITGSSQNISNSLASYYARLNYNFSDRYLLTFTMRADGSSRFGPNNKWGYFPAASLAWRLSNETFMPESNFFSDIKFRVGYGEVGNQQIGNYEYGSSLESATTAFGTAYKPDRIANPNLKWEAGTQFNIGLDLSLLAGRINITADVYEKSTRDFLVTQPLPRYLAAGDGQYAIDAPRVNLGKMENRGIDLAINTHNINTSKFAWDTDVIFSLYRNEILQLDNSSIFDDRVYTYGNNANSIPTRSQVGKPIGQFYGFVTEGIFVSEQDILSHAVQVRRAGSITSEKPQGENYIHRRDGVWLGDVKFKDLNNDRVIDSKDQTFIGNPNPDFTFGFNNSFTYGSFSLGVFLQGSYGGDVVNATRIRIEGMISANNNQAVTVDDRARVVLTDPDAPNIDTDIANASLSNPDATIPRYTSSGVNANARTASNRWIEDGSYLRVQNITLGYTLPTSLISRAKISKMHLYVSGQNMFILTNYSGFDPEVGSNNQSVTQQNVDTGRYPTGRIFTVGVDIDF